MAVPAGVICLWPGAHASIPSGWSRATDLDWRFAKGAPANISPGASGGAATHSHSLAHTHTVTAHTHGAGGTGIPSDFTGTNTGGGGLTSTLNHSHGQAASSSVGGSTASPTTSWSNADSDPPFYGVIHIVSDGSPIGIPAGALAFHNVAAPTGWTAHAASSGLFFKGASTGGNGGSTGGSASHTHTDPSHLHGMGGHAHADTLTASGAVEAMSSADVEKVLPDTTHTHAVTLTPSTGSTSSTASADTGSASPSPAFATLLAVENTTGVADLPDGTICMWMGALNAIPEGWVLCDGTNSTPDLRGRFVKNGAPGTTGGSAAHSHTDPATHTHTTTHSHSASVAAGATVPADNGAGSAATGAHTHVTTYAAAAPGASGATAAPGTSNPDAQPPFRTVAFISLLDALDVVLTYPVAAGTVVEPGFTATWLFPEGETQVAYQLRIYADALGAEGVYDSGLIVSSAQAHTLPTSGVLANATTYYVQVDAQDTLGVTGRTSLTAFTTAWTPPDTITGLTTRAVSDEGTR